MIIFSWTVTPNQLNILKRLAEFEDSGWDRDKWPSACEAVHFLSGSRVLKREHMIFVEEVKRPNSKHTDPRWRVTEKGRLILRMAELEVLDQKKLLENSKGLLNAIKTI